MAHATAPAAVYFTREQPRPLAVAEVMAEPSAGVQTASIEVLGGLGSRLMSYVEHTCSACEQITHVPLRDVGLSGLPVWVPLTRAEFRVEFGHPSEPGHRGIGHNNGGTTYMVGPCERAGAHRMSRCGGCFRPWSIDGQIEPWWLVPLGSS